jgi:ketosteroid isomerase-like protein
VPESREAELAVRAVIDRIDAAWRQKQFDGLADCFDANAVILGPNHAVYASGRAACAESYREFASNAAVLDYAESNHQLRVWGATAVYAFSWRMTYRRDWGSKSEEGTDQLVLGRDGDGWRVLFRYIHFAPPSN